MSKPDWQTPKPLHRRHQFEPIGDGLAWGRKIADSEPQEQQKIGHMDLKLERLSYVIAQQRSLLTGVNWISSRPAIQIPIDCRRS